MVTAKLLQRFQKFQALVQMPRLDGENPHLNYRYSTLSEVLRVVREAATEAGLVIYQTVEPTGIMGSQLRLVTHVATDDPADGEITSEVIVRPVARSGKSNELWDWGSALTYWRRYALALVCGLASEEDTDAEGGRQNAPQPPRQQTHTRQPARPAKDKEGRPYDGETVAEKIVTVANKYPADAARFAGVYDIAADWLESVQPALVGQIAFQLFGKEPEELNAAEKGSIAGWIGKKVDGRYTIREVAAAEAENLAKYFAELEGEDHEEA